MNMPRSLMTAKVTDSTYGYDETTYVMRGNAPVFSALGTKPFECESDEAEMAEDED